MLTADLAVQDHDEIAQNSCMLAHSQGTLRRVVDFRIDATAPADGLSRVSQKTTKSYVTYQMVPYACLLLQPEKIRKNPRVVLVPARTAVKLLLRCSTGKIKSNSLEPHYQTFSDDVAVLRGHQNCCRFATL